MHDPTSLNEADQKDLMLLHNQLVELEKLEIRRVRGDLSDEDFVISCRKRIEESQDLISIVQDRSVVFVSSGVEKLIGYFQEEIIGTPFSRYIHPDALPKVAEYYEKRMSGQEAPIMYETLLAHKNRTRISVKMITARFSYLGRPAGYVILKLMTETE